MRRTRKPRGGAGNEFYCDDDDDGVVAYRCRGGKRCSRPLNSYLKVDYLIAKSTGQVSTPQYHVRSERGPKRNLSSRRVRTEKEIVYLQSTPSYGDEKRRNGDECQKDIEIIAFAVIASFRRYLVACALEKDAISSVTARSFK